MSLLPDDDATFLASILDEELRSKYRKRLKEELSKERKQFQAQRKKFKQDQEDGIADNEAHDEIVNMSIHLFVEKTIFTEEMGYKLRYCDPLYEKDLPNFDFLIIKKGDKRLTAIFGEAKTGNTKAQSIVNEVFAKQKVVEANRDYIIKIYLDDTTTHVDFEYVIAVYPRFVDEIQDALEQAFSAEKKQHGKATITTATTTTNVAELHRKVKTIIWKVDPHTSQLDLANPGKANSDRLRMLHSDNRLNSELKDVEVSRKVFSFFPQSHTATKIKSLITMLEFIKASTGKLEFSAGDVDDYLKSELYYMQEDERKAIRQDILKNAEKIGFIKSIGYDKYAVKEEYSGSSLKGTTVEKLWVSYRIREEHDKAIEECRERVQAEISAEYERKPRMDRFFGP